MSQTENVVTRSSSSLSLARVRPGTVTNGTSKHASSSSSSGAASSSSGAKAQRSASTYHRQRRHSDFCKQAHQRWVTLLVWSTIMKRLRRERWNLWSFLFGVSGGPGVSTSTHPKRSPSGVSEGVGLKEERLSVRKPSTSTIGSRNIPTPSSPMVSSAHNPNKAEIPDRRKDMNSTTVRNRTAFGVVSKHGHLNITSLDNHWGVVGLLLKI